MTSRAERPSRPPTEEERWLFERVVHGAVRLKGSTRLPSAEAPAPPVVAAAAAPVATVPPPHRPTPAVPPAPPPAAPSPGLDRGTRDRLRRGRLPIEGRLDLHGMHQVAAHHALAAFVGAGHAAGRRCLLIVTGKGRPGVLEAGGMERAERGVLRRNVPRWLSLPGLAEKVLAVQPARPEHGGDGALYVLLRRRRERRDEGG